MLIGKIIIRGEIEVKTGLRIGGSTTGLKIGGIDQPVITDSQDKPYIPGSSLKGKLRSLIERKEKVPFNKKDKNGNPFFHQCENEEDYKKCSVCKVFGVLGLKEVKNFTLTRIIVRDIYLDESSVKGMKLELKWTEVKMETAIDRCKGTALGGSLRTIDRVPAGAVFKPMEMIFNVFEEEDKDILVKVFEAMELLEHDYLGGMGSRGYGKIEFKDIEIYWNKKENYEKGTLNSSKINEGFMTPAEIVENFDKIKEKIN